MRPTAPKKSSPGQSGPHNAKLNLSPYKTRTGGTLVCTAQTRENAPRGPVGRFTGILEHRKGNGDMEHIDALEAVRRLTLERDVLAEQVKRLEDSVVWHREELERVSALGEGGNGAPRGCMVPSRTCETCKHAVPGAHAMLCTHHSPHTTGQHGERGHWPVVLKTDRCGDWEGKA